MNLSRTVSIEIVLQHLQMSQEFFINLLGLETVLASSDSPRISRGESFSIVVTLSYEGTSFPCRRIICWSYTGKNSAAC
jgi:hypothetical protein